MPDERRWAKTSGYEKLEYVAILQAFTLQRGEQLEVLGRLDLESWACGAVIDCHRHTVFSQARRMAMHEVEHCDLIEALCRR